MKSKLFSYMAVVAVAAMALFVPLTVLAATPQYSAYYDSSTNNGIRITVSGADSYGQVDFFARQNGGTWTTVTNVGRTDQSGYYSTVMYAGFLNNAGTVESYVTVNGQTSTTIMIGSYNNGNNNTCYAYNSYCNTGSLNFNNSNPVLTVGQSMSVTVNNSYAGNVYVSNNTNSNIVSATVSGNTITLYGNNIGTSSVSVCSNNYSCGTLYVTVNQSNQYNQQLSIYPTTLSQPVTGQYYSVQFQATGGTTPYFYSVNSGGLPAGLSLSNNGWLTGVPYTSGSYNFSVRATDTYGRQFIQYYSGSTYYSGAVAGSSTYSNGTLLLDNKTIYVIYRSTKIGFSSFDAFQGLGFKMDNVTTGSSVNFSNSNYVVNSQFAPHPWGTWMKSGNTVYFMHENGLIPVTNYDVFLNNGGQDKLVVPMTGYDFQRPILSVMEYSDSRLR